MMLEVVLYCLAEELGLSEEALLAHIERLLERGVLTRFGPLFHAERIGGALSLCAMAVPGAELERVAAKVNAHPEVAHNYEREHELNLWFVLATEKLERIETVIAEIERETGISVLNLPKEEEFYIGLHLEA